MAKIKRQELVKYIFAFAVLMLSSLTQFSDKLLPLSAGMYVALISSNFKFAVISPLYLASCLFKGYDLYNLLYALVPIVLMLALKLIIKYTRKDLKIYYYLLAQLIAFIPIIAVSRFNIYFIISAILNILFCYVFSIIFYAMFVRKTILALSIDEKACGFILIAIIAFALYSINIVNVKIYYLFLGFILIYFVYKLNISSAVAILLAITFGASLYDFDLGIVGAALFAYFVGLVFVKLNKYICYFSINLALFMANIYFNAFLNFNYYDLAAFAIGSLVFICIPSKIQNKILSIKKTPPTTCAENLIKRDKLELIKKLNTAESVIYEMAEGYISKETFLKREDVILKLTKNVILQTCEVCSNRENCFKSLNISPEIALRELIDNALICHNANANDVPISIKTRCKNVPKMLSIVNTLVNQYISKIENEKQQSKENRFFSMQMAGIGSILASITGLIKDFPLIDDKFQEQIISELGYNNIFCREALVIASKEKNTVILVVRQKDKEDKKIVDIANKLLKDKLIKKSEELIVDNKMACIFLESSPKYEIAFSNCVVAKGGNVYCGDSQSIVKIKDNKVLIILCDGMGTGEKAQSASQKTLSLVEDFYKAGLDNSKSLILINRALSSINKESFTAVDMCVVDLNFAVTDFIKLGAMPSFIKRKDTVKQIESGALPLGIIDVAKPNVTREVLTLNDIVVLVSDGIMDILKAEGIKEILSRLDSSSPKAVCDEIIGQAKIIGLNDDASIIAFKIFQKF